MGLGIFGMSDSDFIEKYGHSKYSPKEKKAVGLLSDSSETVSFQNSNNKYKLGEPRPHKFNVISSRLFNKNGNSFTLLKVNYPDSSNYSGNKILVYKGDMTKGLDSIKILDPHFLEGHISPIARFIPTLEGKKMAEDFILSQI